MELKVVLNSEPTFWDGILLTIQHPFWICVGLAITIWLMFILKKRDFESDCFYVGMLVLLLSVITFPIHSVVSWEKSHKKWVKNSVIPFMKEQPIQKIILLDYKLKEEVLFDSEHLFESLQDKTFEETNVYHHYDLQFLIKGFLNEKKDVFVKTKVDSHTKKPYVTYKKVPQELHILQEEWVDVVIHLPLKEVKNYK